MKIYKYSLATVSEQFLVMPKGAAVLTIQKQAGCPYIWAEVDPDAKRIRRKFITLGTGNTFADSPGHYIGTYQMEEGTLVHHVFTDRKEYAL